MQRGAQRAPEQTNKGRASAVRCLGAPVAPKVILELVEYVESAGMEAKATWMPLVKSFGKSR
jgi:hypothetical protein